MILSIVVLSYNRPKEIERLLNKLSCVSSGNFEVIIKDDCSPACEDIRSIVDFYRDKLKFNLIFHQNSHNLGYDLNLLDAFNISQSDFVFLLSDDDFLDGSKIDELLDFLKSTEVDVIFTPYFSNGSYFRYAISGFNINNFHNFIYNSILFSGLIFRRSSVLSLRLNLDFLSNCIYSQVFLSCYLVFANKSFAVAPRGLLFLGGDGDNFFGRNQSAVNSELLMDRSTIIANFKYQSFLIDTVWNLANATDFAIYKNFLKHYNLRLVAYFFRARSFGFVEYRSLFNIVFNSNLSLPIFVKFTIVLIGFIPSILCLHLYRFGFKYFRRSG